MVRTPAPLERPGSQRWRMRDRLSPPSSGITVKTVADLRAGDRVRYRGIILDVLRVEDTIPQFTREPLRVIYGQAGDAAPAHVAWPVGDFVEIIAEAA